MKRFVQFLIATLIAIVSIGLIAAARGNSAVRAQIDRVTERVRAELTQAETALNPEVMS